MTIITGIHFLANKVRSLPQSKNLFRYKVSGVFFFTEKGDQVVTGCFVTDKCHTKQNSAFILGKVITIIDSREFSKIFYFIKLDIPNS